MSNKITRRKPGFTRSGEIKIISLSVSQLTELKEKTQTKKKRVKIQRRIDLLKSRPGYFEPVTQVIDDTAK
jgi:hypothetical protein